MVSYDPVVERNVYIRTAYDGTKFHGWQDQPGMRTVQLVLQKVLMRVCRHPVNLLASGRTDSGVHALGHASCFRTTRDIPVDRIMYAANARLDEDVAIVEAREVIPEFHATHDALSKMYRYRIYNHIQRPVTELCQRYTNHFWKRLDEQSMHEAAQHIVGTHDFSGLASTRCQKQDKVRTVYRCDVQRVNNEIQIEVEGNGFLYNMVRNIAGTLVEIGRGHWKPEKMIEIIDSRDRNQAGPTAPPQGLTLVWVKYPESSFISDSPKPGNNKAEPTPIE